VPRLLVVAYHFPPVGGAGVQRTVKFVRYLPEFGYEPVVVTGPVGSVGEKYLTDEVLGGELPADLEVHRVSGPEATPSHGWTARRERWLRRPSPWARWWIDGAVRAAAGAGSVDAVFATMSPFESADVGARLGRQLGVPWVADLRDPWALDEMFVYPSALHRRAELSRMRRLLGTAAAVVMNTPEAARQLQLAFPEFRGKQVAAIPNGFDPRDFDHPPAPRDDGTFRIAHTGELHTELGLISRRTARARRLLGGALSDVDILPRSHVYLVRALEQIAAERPELGSRIELHLAGLITEADRQAYGSANVKELGYLSHPESVALLQSSDLLFLPMHDLPEGTRARIVPGKTYEYLATGRPVLAAVPDGDARELLVQAGTGLPCRPKDVECMARTVTEQVERVARGEPAPVADPEVLAKYERRHLTERLAAALDSMLDLDRREAHA
jgi:glycosyltransferase involved in cell wall biosynthesis